MGLFLKRDEICTFLKEQQQYDGTEKIIWANIGNAQGQMVVLVFNKIGLSILPITPLGKLQGYIVFSLNDDIKSITFKKGLIAYKLTIETSDMKINTFRVNKAMIGYSEHKDELKQLLEMYL